MSICHSHLKKIRKKGDLTIALIGNPNVGKSCIFNQLTGLRVITANYPGTTVDLHFGIARYDSTRIAVVDLPGIYGVSALYEDQWVARRALLEEDYDAVVIVVDASNLQRNLYLVFQLLEMELPVMVCLNKVDYAEKVGLKVDHKRLSKMLKVPVIPTVAIKGKGIRELLQAVIDKARKRTERGTFKVTYDTTIERAIGEIEALIENGPVKLPYKIPSRAMAILLLEKDPECVTFLRKWGEEGDKILQKIFKIVEEATLRVGKPANLQLSYERHRLARTIAMNVTEYSKIIPFLTRKLDELTLQPSTGFPIMLSVLATLFAFVFYAGGFLEGLFLGGWEAYVSPAFNNLLTLFPKAAAEFLNIGINLGMESIISIMVPYIVTFFLALSIIEDSGLLTRMAFLIDSFSRKIGLSGRAIIPMLGGFGCNVPAIMATRVLNRRERYILALLITMIPCSARTAVILGTVFYFLGISYTLVLYAIILGLILLVGRIFHKAMPQRGIESSLILEITQLQMPTLSTTFQKVWMMVSAFIYRAVPMLMLGSLLIAGLQAFGILNTIVEPLSPLTSGILGLPAITIIPLLYGFIRKEGALIILALVLGTSNIASAMTPLQLFTFALVVSLYVPCIATIAVLSREFGWKNALLISLGTFLIALTVGSIFYHSNLLGL